MKNITKIISLVFLISPCCYSIEEFEGEITYEIEVQSFDQEHLPESFLRDNYGIVMRRYFKDGFIRSLYYGADPGWEIYSPVTNKMYMRLKSDDGIVVTDGDKEERGLKSFSVSDSTLSVLGQKLRMIEVLYDNGDISRYWYSPSLYVNPESFENYTFAYQNKYWNEAQSPYLKHERVFKRWKVVYTASKIEMKDLDERLFDIVHFPFNDADVSGLVASNPINTLITSGFCGASAAKGQELPPNAQASLSISCH